MCVCVCVGVCVGGWVGACVRVDIVICMCCVLLHKYMSNGDYHTHTSHHTTACMRLQR